MNRIKDITKIKVHPEYVLVKLENPKKSSLILDQKSAAQTRGHYAKVLKVGSKTTYVEVGDVVVKSNLERAKYFEHPTGEYALIPEYSIDVVTTEDNFDHNITPNEKTRKESDKSVQ